MARNEFRIGECFFGEGRFWTLQVGECPRRNSEHPNPHPIDEGPDFFDAIFRSHPMGFVSGEYRCSVCDEPWPNHYFTHK